MFLRQAVGAGREAPVSGNSPEAVLKRFRRRYGRRLAAPLEECERLLEEVSSRPGGALGEACRETLAAGGKRLRPMMVFLSCRRDAPVAAGVTAAAAAVELVHMATLIHDDVIDAASLRRGRPTLVATRGEAASAAAGDYLFAAAFDLLASTGATAAVSLLARASLGLSRGELLQMGAAWDYGLGADAYLERCRLKTAGLFDAACRLGALYSDCPPATTAAMGRFGEHLGLAFQITDDILDLAGESADTGKAPGADLRDGTVTLPLILAMAADPELVRELKAGPVEGREEELCSRVAATGGLEAARNEALGYIRRAEELLAAAEGVDAAPLKLIAQAMVDRIA